MNCPVLVFFETLLRGSLSSLCSHESGFDSSPLSSKTLFPGRRRFASVVVSVLQSYCSDEDSGSENPTSLDLMRKDERKHNGHVLSYCEVDTREMKIQPMSVA